MNAAPRSPYAAAIGAILTQEARADCSPRHIEAWMRSEYGTLDSLSPAEFAADVVLCIGLVDQAEPGLSERLAQSYGL